MKYLLEFESQREMDEWAVSRVEAMKRRSRKPKPSFNLDVLGPRQRAVIDFLRGGVQRRTKDVTEMLNVPGPNASGVLRSLEDRTMIRKVRRGVWQINPDMPE